MGALFGTDGVRARAGEGPLAPERVPRLGLAIGRAAREAGAREGATVPIARDPRPSGPAIAGGLARGLAAAGLRPLDAGVLPTPALSFVVARGSHVLGLVVSASHNPPCDNGVKVFSADGSKASDARQRRIEELFDLADAGEGAGTPALDDAAAGKHEAPRRLPRRERDAYVHALVAFGGGAGALAGRRIAIDCARGATCAVAREVFGRLGADLVLLACEEDGERINEGVGATHPEAVAGLVRDEGLWAGFAFDGDGDRVIAVVESGEVRDGDDILLALGLAALEDGRLPGHAVVATVMSNLGLELRLKERGIRLVRTPVGDRFVAREITRHRYALGGEQSGHIILRDGAAPTGDGLACAVRLCLAARGRRALSELLTGFARVPQMLEKVPVGRKPPFDEVPELGALIREAEGRLGDSGRVLLRYSGTEPILRVMVEHEDEALTRSLCRELTERIGAIAALRGAEEGRREDI